ncbi:alkaline phosphatase family protein [Thermoactinospora rubra]|uniref:alkaline phosphatase family protein n=1 Tax=Thermoactinospora rubra TaxID=1088767 RepID=UPI000A1135CA|nr:alkaline phosphatase family protein [Thermoactinospora rubra]
MINKVLVVGMDGLRFDRLLALAPPVLSALMAEGSHGVSRLPYGEAAAPRTESPGEVVEEHPEEHSGKRAGVPAGDGVVQPGRVIRARTDSGPGWSSIATGVWPDKHGVVDNSFTGANFTKYPDFLTRVKRARPDLRTYAIVSWAALGEHGAFGPEIDDRVVHDGYADGWAACDKRVADVAERHLAETDVDAAFVYFGETDEVAHALGPMCQEYADALLLQDAYLGRLLEAVRRRPSYAEERWTVLVTTDHGHVDAGGHGGVSEEERTTFVILSEPGELGSPRLVDVAPTVLHRLGVAADPAWGLDGVPLIPR